MTPSLTAVLIVAALAVLLLLAFRLLSRWGKKQSPLQGTTTPIEAAGTIVNAANCFPLDGLHVRVRLVEPESESGEMERGGVLGEAVSDSRGMFRILFTSSSTMEQTSDGIEERTSMSSLALEVSDAAGSVLLSQPFSSGLSVSLRVQLPAVAITTAHWKEAGARLKQARIARLNELTRSLISVSPARARFADWDVATRHAVLSALETAFLDPRGALSAIGAPPPGFLALRSQTKLDDYRRSIEPHMSDANVRKAFSEMAGKVMSFPDLLFVDWVIDLNEFESGNTGAALGKFEDEYKVKKWDVHQPFDPDLLDRLTTIDTAPPLPPDEPALIPYRDYLLKVYVYLVAVAKHQGQAPFTPQDDDASVSLLEKRFKQNFRTQKLETQWANGLLIPIVTGVLTSPPGGGYGFGVPAEQLDPQGARTNRQYLDYLIDLTKRTAAELGLRYRVDLQRSDFAVSSEVHENIFTLQNFFSDTYECPPEPFPVVPSLFQGKAPFYLEYEEWLGDQTPFYPENFYAIKQAYSTGYAADERAAMIKISLSDAKLGDWRFWYKNLFLLEDELALGNKAFTQDQYVVALDHYNKALAHSGLVRSYTGKPIEVKNESYPVKISDLKSDKNIKNSYKEARDRSIHTMAELDRFTGLFSFSIYPKPRAEYTPPWEDWPYHKPVRMQFAVHHLIDFVLPVCRADVALAMGDYPAAIKEYEAITGFRLYAAHEQDEPGYEYPLTLSAEQHKDGNLPFSSSTQAGATDLNKVLHPMELAFFTLRQGQAMLEWADALYRRGDPARASRARETYKAVLWLHGEPPPITPEWGSTFEFNLSSFMSNLFVNDAENPALTSQKTRARRGFFQIEAGLNYYGYADDMVPTLRYRPLKGAAGRFAALAKAAQRDYLNAMQQVEGATVEAIKTADMIKKAGVQVKIAGEQAKIAKNGQVQAQFQVEQVKAAIAAKEAEIDDKGSILNQFKEYFSGLQSVVTSLPEGAKSKAGPEIQTGVGLGEGADAGMLGEAAGGAAVVGGFALFFYASYTTLSSMNDAANKRKGELANLKKTLPLAEAQIDTRKREIVIAGLQAQIAQCDIELANELITFQADRFLNQEFWSNMAALMHRVLRRYLEMGARNAWLAERALAYEQDRAIRIIRFDYFPAKTRDITGADLLQLDLAELEATRLTGIREMIPVKHTFSMARDFPLAFGRLKQTGRCDFQTFESSFRDVYPGTYGYRIIAVTSVVSSTAPVSPLRALLTNEGFSLISRQSENERHLSLRPRDALPLSEFRLRDDMTVYGMPGETLMPFEGSGVETAWGLEISFAGNPYGLDTTADILLTFDVRAYYSHELHQKAKPPSSVSRIVLVSAAMHLQKSLADLQGKEAQVAFDFDITAVGLPAREANRKVTNVAIFLAARKPPTFNATVSVVDPGPNQPESNKTVVPFTGGIAFSNAPPFSDGSSALPLNSFVGQTTDQIFRVAIDKSQNPDADFSSVSDVVLGLEYHADIPS